MNDDLPLDQRQFVLLKNGGRDDRANVLGGVVEWRNVFISEYTTVVDGQKPKADLAVNETTIVVGAICGRKCDRRRKDSYKLLRVR